MVSHILSIGGLAGIGYANLPKLENLSDTLSEFSCSYNLITKIENLPCKLLDFDCSNNPITKF